jgi:hypothetical protein
LGDDGKEGESCGEFEQPVGDGRKKKRWKWRLEVEEFVLKVGWLKVKLAIASLLKSFC